MPFRTCSRKVAVSRSLLAPGLATGQGIVPPTAASALCAAIACLEEEESKGRLRLQIDADVDTAMLRREMERARGTTGGESATTTARPTGPSLLVGGDSSEEASATVVKTLGGWRCPGASGRCARRALTGGRGRAPGGARRFGWSPPRPAKGSIRGASSVSVRCELRARLLAAAWVQDPLFSITPKQSGDSPATRPPHGLRAGKRAAGALARQPVRLASARSRGCALPDPGPGRGRAGRAHDAASGCEAPGRGECG